MFKNIFILFLAGVIMALGTRTLLTDSEKEQIKTIVHQKIDKIKDALNQPQAHNKSSAQNSKPSAKRREDNQLAPKNKVASSALPSAGDTEKKRDFPPINESSPSKTDGVEAHKAVSFTQDSSTPEHKQDEEADPVEILSLQLPPQPAQEQLSQKDVERVLNILDAAKRYLDNAAFDSDENDTKSKPSEVSPQVSRIKKKLSGGPTG